MVEPMLPAFADPGSYVRYFGPNVLNAPDTTLKTRYIRLLERSAPLRYPYSFKQNSATLLGVDAKSNTIVFSDLEAGIGHVYQTFLGVQPGLRVQVFAPFDTRVLQWDQTVTLISTDQAAVLTHAISPYEDPVFEMWIPPNKNYPALLAQNATADLLGFCGGINGGVGMGKGIYPRVIFISASFRVQMIDASQPGSDDTAVNGVLLDMLDKKKIPSKPITFGGSQRVIPS